MQDNSTDPEIIYSKLPDRDETVQQTSDLEEQLRAKLAEEKERRLETAANVLARQGQQTELPPPISLAATDSSRSSSSNLTIGKEDDIYGSIQTGETLADEKRKRAQLAQTEPRENTPTQEGLYSSLPNPLSEQDAAPSSSLRMSARNANDIAQGRKPRYESVPTEPGLQTNPLRRSVGVNKELFDRLSPDQQKTARDKILGTSRTSDRADSIGPEDDIYGSIITGKTIADEKREKAQLAQTQPQENKPTPRELEPKEEKLIKQMVDKELTNREKASGMGFIKRFQNRKVHAEALKDRTEKLVGSGGLAGTEIGKIAQYNKQGLETIVKHAVDYPDQSHNLSRIQRNHQGINDFLKTVDPKAQERFAANSSNIFPSKRFANRAAAAFVKIDRDFGTANTANIAQFAEAYKTANPGKDGKGTFPKEFIDNPKLNGTLIHAATSHPDTTKQVINKMKEGVVNLDKPKDFNKVFIPTMNAVKISGKLESADVTLDLIKSDAKRTGIAAAIRGELDSKKVDAITRGTQPGGEVNKPIDKMSKNERLQQSAHIATNYPNVHKLAEEALKEQSQTTGKAGKATYNGTQKLDC